jgi:hypothetical protein
MLDSAAEADVDEKPADEPSRLDRIIEHEWTSAVLGSLLLAVLMVWLLPPIVLWMIDGTPLQFPNPATTIVGDIGDPTAQAWLLGWDGHAILHAPGQLWNTNGFYPQTLGLALNDALLGYIPFGLFGDGVTAAIVRYNLLYVLAFAMAFFGGYALLRQVGANKVGAAVAGAVLAFAPWRYGHDGHLNILSSGGITLALAMLARGHGFSLGRPSTGSPRAQRPGWALAGWLMACWQISLGFGIGLGFVYVLAFSCLVAAIWWGVAALRGDRRTYSRRLLIFDAVGGVLFAVVSLLMARPYQEIRDRYPDVKRPWDYVQLFSPTWKSMLVAPQDSLTWGDAHANARAALGVAVTEKVLLCGFILYLLALCGLVFSAWSVRARVLMAVGTLVGMDLALGPNGALYVYLYNDFPGFDGSRTPGRLILWPTLLLAALAAGCVTSLGRLTLTRAHLTRVVTGFSLVILLGVLIEGLPRTEHPIAPQEPAAMAAAKNNGPIMVLPSDEGNDLNIQFWSVDGFPTMVNGAASVSTPDHQAIRDVMQTFPSQESLDWLHKLHVHSVVVIRGRVVGTPFEGALNVQSNSQLGITRQDISGDVLFTLTG